MRVCDIRTWHQASSCENLYEIKYLNKNCLLFNTQLLSAISNVRSVILFMHPKLFSLYYFIYISRYFNDASYGVKKTTKNIKNGQYHLFPILQLIESTEKGKTSII